MTQPDAKQGRSELPADGVCSLQVVTETVGDPNSGGLTAVAGLEIHAEGHARSTGARHTATRETVKQWLEKGMLFDKIITKHILTK